MTFRDGFDRMCGSLILVFIAFLILIGGIRAAGGVIDFAKTQQIEMINNLVEGLSTDPAQKIQPKKIQDMTFKYISAFVQALAQFEFMPRNEFRVLAEVVGAVPAQTEVLSFAYHGRNLTISTAQPTPESALKMADRLEESDQFFQVVLSYYLDEEQGCLAELTLIPFQYDKPS